jgi:thiosulfate/3-mercaptopyruvate sulfurtransferase
MHKTVVSPETLFAHLGDSSWIAIDCRHSLADFGLGRKLYNEGHIPGAFFADPENDLSGEKTGNNGRHPLPDPEKFAAFLRGLGVNDNTQIVAYDAGADMFAARLWFLCRWIGHDAVAVLDGGITAWTAAGYPLTVDASHVRNEGSIGVQLRPHLVVDAKHVLDHLRSSVMHLLDARAADRYAGQNETVDPGAGHIPGAHNRSFKNNFDDHGRWKSPEMLRLDFSAHGMPDNVIHQCGSGVSAAVNMLAMERAGLTGSRIYSGSWSEWIADSDRPIATGSAP